jgi:hypothetical protein
LLFEGETIGNSFYRSAASITPDGVILSEAGSPIEVYLAHQTPNSKLKTLSQHGKMIDGVFTAEAVDDRTNPLTKLVWLSIDPKCNPNF